MNHEERVNLFQSVRDFYDAGRFKYVVTDPCYLVPDGEWHDLFGDSVNRRIWTKKSKSDREHWDRMTELGYNNDVVYDPYHMSHSMDLTLVMLPQRFGDVNITHMASVPMGDIQCEFKNQSYGFDSGTVCIAEVPLTWTIPKEEGHHYEGLMAVYEDYYDAQRALQLAVAWEFVQEDTDLQARNWVETIRRIYDD